MAWNAPSWNPGWRSNRLQGAPYDPLDYSGAAEAGPSGWQTVPYRGTPLPDIPYPRSRRRNGSHSVAQIDLKNGIDDKALELEGLAKKVLLVMRLKNAMTYLAEVIDMCDMVDSATSHLHVWESYVGANLDVVRNTIESIQRVAHEINSNYTNLNGAIREVLRISLDISPAPRVWEEAYGPGRQKHGRQFKPGTSRQNKRSNTASYLDYLKVNLQPWKSTGFRKVDEWLQGAKGRLACMRESIANFEAQSEQIGQYGY